MFVNKKKLKKLLPILAGISRPEILENHLKKENKRTINNVR
jgi:hypothetical protein